jgi:hypothetical protein
MLNTGLTAFRAQRRAEETPLWGISSMMGGTLTSLYDFSLDTAPLPVLISNG